MTGARSRAAAFAAALLLAAAIGAVGVRAADGGAIDDIKNAAPDDIAELLPDDIADTSDPASALGIDYVFSILLDAVKESLAPASGFLSVILGTLLISSAFRMFAGGISDGALSEPVSVITCLSLAVYAVVIMEQLSARVELFARSTSTFTITSVPILHALLTSTGNITSASVTSTGLLTFSAALQYTAAYIFVPLYKLGLALSVVTSVTSASAGASGVCAAVKRAFVWLAAGASTVFSAVLAYQTELVAAADTAAARGLRYTVSSAVPIVGGAVGDALRTAASGLSVIKNGAGAVGIAVLILLSCPLLISLFMTSAGLGIGAFAADALGCSRESALLSELRSCVGFAIAIVALAAVVFVFALALFMKTAPAVAV